MLNKTTETAIMALLYLALKGDQRPVSPRVVATGLSISPSYLAKTFNTLRKAGILHAHRGVQGGVTLSRSPSEITLFDIVVACQEQSVREAPSPPERMSSKCNFHQAMISFGRTMEALLSRWSLADLAADPCPALVPADSEFCRVSGICPKRLIATTEEERE